MGELSVWKLWGQGQPIRFRLSVLKTGVHEIELAPSCTLGLQVGAYAAVVYCSIRVCALSATDVRTPVETQRIRTSLVKIVPQSTHLRQGTCVCVVYVQASKHVCC
jgi:hypothetical protein